MKLRLIIWQVPAMVSWQRSLLVNVVLRPGVEKAIARYTLTRHVFTDDRKHESFLGQQTNSSNDSMNIKIPTLPIPSSIFWQDVTRLFQSKMATCNPCKYLTKVRKIGPLKGQMTSQVSVSQSQSFPFEKKREKERERELGGGSKREND